MNIGGALVSITAQGINDLVKALMQLNGVSGNGWIGKWLFKNTSSKYRYIDISMLVFLQNEAEQSDITKLHCTN